MGSHQGGTVTDGSRLRERPLGPRSKLLLGFVPLVLALIIWIALDVFAELPIFKFPPLTAVFADFWELLKNGDLIDAIIASLSRLAIAFLIGASFGLVVGITISSSERAAVFIRPLVLFFQAIAGVAWIPLAIIWFGFGSGTVIFIVANAVFFIVLFNTLVGVQTIPRVLVEASQALGATRTQILTQVTIPGALAHVLVGFETGLAFAWRALVAAELIVASTGLGWLTLEASRRFDSPTIVLGIIVIGLIWLLLERLLLRPVRRWTVDRWGITSGAAA